MLPQALENTVTDCSPAAVPDYIQQARELAALMAHRHWSQTRAAQYLGISQSAVANKLRLLRLPETVHAALAAHCLSQRHARALLRLPTEQQQLAAVEYIVKHGLSVVYTDLYIDALLQPLATTERKSLNQFLAAVRQALASLTASGIPAQIAQTQSGQELVLTIRIGANTESGLPSDI